MARLVGGHAFRGLRTLLGAAYRSARWVTVGALGLYPIARVESVVVAVGLRWTIDAAVSGSGHRAVLALGTVVAGVSLFHIIDQIAWRLCLRLEDVVGHALDRRTAELVADTPGIEHFERPEYLDRVEILREQGWMLGRNLYNLPMVWGDIARTIATIGLLATVHPLLLLLPLFGLPSLITESLAEGISRRAEESTAGDLRRARHLLDLSVRPDAAKELRIFGLREWLLRSHRRVWSDVQSVLRPARARSALRVSVGWLAFGGAFVAAVAVVTKSVLSGSASLGDLILTLTLGARVAGEVGSAASNANRLRRIARLAGHLAWLEDYAAAAADDTTQQPYEGLGEGIVLEGVSFRYPGAESYALREVSLRLPAGSTVALVGQNGAGGRQPW